VVLRLWKVWRGESYISYVFVGLSKSCDLEIGFRSRRQGCEIRTVIGAEGDRIGGTLAGKVIRHRSAKAVID
jgi:hypothetical protein